MTSTARNTPPPFTARDHEARMARAAWAGRDAGLTGILVTPGPDLAWLTGYQPTAITERLTMLVLDPDRDPVMLVPVLERPDAESAVGAGALAIVDWADGTDPYDRAAALLDPAGRYGVSDSTWSMHLLGLQRRLPGTGYRPLTEALPMLRAVKDDHELARLERAGAAADAAFHGIVDVAFAGRRELDVAADLADLLRRHGHERVDFTIVGSGPNGADPHHEAGERVIQPGDAVVLDFGGLRDGYGSDTTRTVCVGAPSARLREVHAVVRDAQQAAFEAVQPGVPCERIDAIARNVIDRAGYGPRFVHRTGHGIGVTTHEPPYIVTGEPQPLVPGMCFSIEPGIYLPGRFGVRIEDIVTVTRDAGRRFNNTPRELRVVD